MLANVAVNKLTVQARGQSIDTYRRHDYLSSEGYGATRRAFTPVASAGLQHV